MMREDKDLRFSGLPIYLLLSMAIDLKADFFTRIDPSGRLFKLKAVGAPRSGPNLLDRSVVNYGLHQHSGGNCRSIDIGFTYKLMWRWGRSLAPIL